MYRNSLRFSVIGAATLMTAGLMTASGLNAAGYYEGKTITLIVGFPAGGGVDASARVMADHLSKHIEGKPDVIVKNMSGGASIKAQNFVYEKARPDGTTVFFGPWFPIAQIVKAPGVRFRYEKFTAIAAMAAGQAIFYGRASLLPGGSKDPKDIVKVKGLKLAGSHPTNPMDARARLSLDLLGMKYNYVRGYRGSTKIRAAILNGEVDAGGDSIRGYLGAIKPTMVATGKAIPLWTFPVPDASGKLGRVMDTPKIPTVVDVYRSINGKEPSGATWDALKFILEAYGTASHFYLGPPTMNKAARDALSKGIYATARDKKYLASAAKRFKTTPVHRELSLAVQAIKKLASIDPKVKPTIQVHVKAGLK
jgi:hypothetical protein